MVCSCWSGYMEGMLMGHDYLCDVSVTCVTWRWRVRRICGTLVVVRPHGRGADGSRLPVTPRDVSVTCVTRRWWWSGHMEEVLMGGNRGPVIVRKANDPHR